MNYFEPRYGSIGRPNDLRPLTKRDLRRLRCETSASEGYKHEAKAKTWGDFLDHCSSVPQNESLAVSPILHQCHSLPDAKPALGKGLVLLIAVQNIREQTVKHVMATGNSSPLPHEPDPLMLSPLNFARHPALLP
jgi:hypothetical protein